MAEMDLIIKPRFQEGSAKKLGNEIGSHIGGGSSGDNEGKKEQKKQTEALNQILKFTKIGVAVAVLGKAATATSDVAGVVTSIASGVSETILGDNNEQLALSLTLGSSVNEEAAERIRNGEKLVDVLDEQTILSEYLEQKELNSLTNSKQSANNMRTLSQVWVEIQKSSGKNAEQIVDLNTASSEHKTKLDDIYNQWVLINEQANAYIELLAQANQEGSGIATTTAGVIAAIDDASSGYNGPTVKFDSSGNIVLNRGGN